MQTCAVVGGTGFARPQSLRHKPHSSADGRWVRSGPGTNLLRAKGKRTIAHRFPNKEKGVVGNQLRGASEGREEESFGTSGTRAPSDQPEGGEQLLVRGEDDVAGRALVGV